MAHVTPPHPTPPATAQDSEDRLHPSTHPPSLRVKLVDAETGVGAFATRRYEVGDSVLHEAPVVFAQSYETWNTSPVHETPSNEEGLPEASHKRVRCCFGCGATLLAFLWEECARLDRLHRDALESQRPTTPLATSSPPSTPPPPLPSTWTLVQALRLSHLADAMQQAPDSTPHVAGAPHAVEVDAMARQHVVHFCSPSCAARSLGDEGRRFVLWPPQMADPEATTTTTTTATASTATPASSQFTTHAEDLLVEELRYPSADAILVFAQHPPSLALRQAAWPSRRHVLSTLHAVARRCNERVWLLTLLLAKQLHRTLDAVAAPTANCTFATWLGHGATAVAAVFRECLEGLLGDYAEGAMELLSPEQRALLRFSWYLMTWWWVLCCAEAYTDSQEKLLVGGGAADGTRDVRVGRLVTADALEVSQSLAFPLQLYLQLHWLTNANVHMYVVVCPLYTLWCRWLQTKGHVKREADDSGDDAAAAAADTALLFRRLYSLFHDAHAHVPELSDAAAPAATTGELGTSQQTTSNNNTSSCSSDGLHAIGVALYDQATKLNHSCAPNVCFQPTIGAVAAAVVALRDIEAGEQLFTSYIRVDDFGDRHTDAAALRRRRYLEDHYGFSCQCPLCTR